MALQGKGLVFLFLVPGPARTVVQSHEFQEGHVRRRSFGDVVAIVPDEVGQLLGFMDVHSRQYGDGREEEHHDGGDEALHRPLNYHGERKLIPARRGKTM